MVFKTHYIIKTDSNTSIIIDFTSYQQCIRFFGYMSFSNMKFILGEHLHTLHEIWLFYQTSDSSECHTLQPLLDLRQEFYYNP